MISKTYIVFVNTTKFTATTDIITFMIGKAITIDEERKRLTHFNY